LISASGFPGRRVDAMRAGMTTIGFIWAFQWVDGAGPYPYGAANLWMRRAARNAAARRA
jgi:hypothetical protein